jgi:IPT/TIG domain-containing protein
VSRTTVLLAAALLLTSGCHRHWGASWGKSVSIEAGSKPVIEALVPDSIRFGADAADLTIQGRNFATDDASGNTVNVGPVTLTHVAARASGTQLRVRLPSTWSGSEAPPRPLPPGEYQVIVRTGTGTSNALTLRIVP